MSTIVEVHGATARVGVTRILESSSITIEAGQIWAFLGGNGSGKTVLSELVSGRRRPASGEVCYAGNVTPADIQVLSFEEQFRLIERERKIDETWLLDGETDPGTTVSEFVSAPTTLGRTAPGDTGADGGPDKTLVSDLLKRFHLTHRADAGLRFLSTGEIRKAILCRALALRPRLLVLDDPFDGLDAEANGDLHAIIPTLASADHAAILVLGREAHVSDAVTHVAHLAARQVTYAGPRDGFETWRREAGVSGRGSRDAVNDSQVERIPGAERPGQVDGPDNEPILRLEEVSVSYGDKSLLSRVSWEARQGETWHVVGPNGAGKTTLLSLLSGGNTKAYGQDVWLFGQKRGSGESVWDIKRKIGLISGDFHHGYPLRTGTLDAILSGFADSAGLYESPTGYQSEIAKAWLDIIGLDGRGGIQLRKLSYGEQRAVLVARAMVKMPPLLIADEPCQGLDDLHSNLVLSLLERISRETSTCILYVSHDPELRLRTATHRLTLNPGNSGSTATTESLSSPA
jgi:molybdate transport system ATP-binding protein